MPRKTALAPSADSQDPVFALAGDPHIDDRGLLGALPSWQDLIQMLVGIHTTIGRRPCGTQTYLAVPSLQRLDTDANSLRKL